MSFLKYAYEKQRKETIHLTLIDPTDVSSIIAGQIAYTAEKVGTDAIMIGGSTPVKQQLLDDIIKEVKSKTKLPVILFPGSAGGISKYADAIFFMQLLNSRNLKYVIGEQAKGAPIVHKLVKKGLEAIPVGYLVIEPGMTVGKVGEADLIKRDCVDDAVSYAIAAQYSGKKVFYLEAGSGALEHVPKEMVSAVKNGFDYRESLQPTPILIVGGGIRKPEHAKELAEAGADAIVTGTIVESSDSLEDVLGKVVNAIKNK